MKIVGLILILALILPIAALADFKCKGDVYSRLDNGELAAEKVEFIPNNFQNVLASVKSDGPFVFKTDRKSDEWEYVRTFNHNEMLYIRGYRNLEPAFNYEDIRLDRSSFLKFKENAIVGFNLVCKM